QNEKLTVSRTSRERSARSADPEHWRRPSQAETRRAATAPSTPPRGPTRTSGACSTTEPQAARTPSGSAGDRAGALHAADLVLDQLEVLLRQLVDVALKGQRPVLRRPLADVFQPVGEVLGRQPLTVLENGGRLDADTPGVLLLTAGAAPAVSNVLREAPGGGAPGREDQPPRRPAEQEGDGPSP